MGIIKLNRDENEKEVWVVGDCLNKGDVSGKFLCILCVGYVDYGGKKNASITYSAICTKH